MNPYDYSSRLQRPLAERLADFQEGARFKHVILAQQFTKENLEHFASVANKVRSLARSRKGSDFLGSLLSHKRAMLYFTQPSTRTFLSFMGACQILGIRCSEIRDPRVSSEYKGEQPMDSLRMFSSYCDLIIMRSVIRNLAERCAYLMNDLEHQHKRHIPILNGGSGSDEHPTQALLDYYTIRSHFGLGKPDQNERFENFRARYSELTRGISNKTFCFCGDIGRGRTVKSLATLLSLYENVTMIFVSPDHEQLRLPEELKDQLLEAGANIEETDDLDSAIPRSDILYMTRIQHEYDNEDDKLFFSSYEPDRFMLTPERVNRMRPYAGILHPFPRNEEIPLEVDLDSRVLYFRQARNGMWARAALIASLFGVDDDILSA